MGRKDGAVGDAIGGAVGDATGAVGAAIRAAGRWRCWGHGLRDGRHNGSSERCTRSRGRCNRRQEQYY